MALGVSGANWQYCSYKRFLIRIYLLDQVVKKITFKSNQIIFIGICMSAF